MPTTTRLIPMPQNGSATSLKVATSRRVTLTSEASLTCAPPTSWATSKPISSPASGAGHSPSDSRDGQIIALSGQAPVHVSRFRSLDTEKAMPIADTCGPLFTASSQSARLQSSLESKLRARMDVNGSRLYGLTWSMWDMPSGPPICRLRAKPRKSDKDFGGWPAPCASDGKSDGISFDLMTRRKTHSRGVRWPETAMRRLNMRGYANPLFSCFLMQFPMQWHSCAPTVTPSSRKSRRNSLKQS